MCEVCLRVLLAQKKYILFVYILSIGISVFYNIYLGRGHCKSM